MTEAEAPNPHRLYLTSKPFLFAKLWMGIWVHPYTVTLVQVGVDLRKPGVWGMAEPE
jgi:hypothetical protein